MVNRYVIPVIEGHKAEGRVEGREQGLAEARGRVASVERGAASPLSVKDGSSPSRRRKVKDTKSVAPFGRAVFRPRPSPTWDPAP